MNFKHLLQLSKQMASALAYLHQLHIVHLDIKPDNILELDDHHDHIFKLCDFGLANHITTLNLNNEEGDRRYLPIEALTNENLQAKKVDLFSLGCTLYELALGKPLPKSGEAWHQFRHSPKIDLLQHIDQQFINIILNLLSPIPSTRYTAQQLVEELNKF